MSEVAQQQSRLKDLIAKGKEQGSWVNLCTDDKGRLLVSDQFGGMYRITPPKAGESITQADVEPVPAKIRAINGMVWLAMT